MDLKWILNGKQKHVSFPRFFFKAREIDRERERSDVYHLNGSSPVAPFNAAWCRQKRKKKKKEKWKNLKEIYGVYC